MDFEKLAVELSGQSSRWALWAQMQASYLAVLHGQGISDGVADCSQAALRETGKLAFIVVPTGSALERRTLTELGPRFVSMVLAPDPGEGDSGFDGLGFLLPGYWSHAHVPLELSDWHVEESPADQARRACLVLQDWSQHALESGALSPRDVVLAAPDEEVRPFLERHLQRAGLAARDAAGSPLEQGPPAQLLQALARLLPDQRFTDAARVLRHTDMEQALARQATLEGADWPDVVACLDAYHEGPAFPGSLEFGVPIFGRDAAGMEWADSGTW
ncbi:MAG: hypothetical protein P1U53_18715 [Sulfitobacter sp.]|nr:hypothetical protein [Sulfitobacter sp.]